MLAFSVGLAAPPTTPRRPVSTVYHGVTVTDDYQWLEDGRNPAVRAWTAEQNQFTRAYLDPLPVRGPLLEILEEEYEGAYPTFFALAYRTGLVFALKFKPPAQQPMLVTFTSIHRMATQKMLLNPNRLNTNGAVAIDWYVPSPDGKWVAVSLSENGSEEGTLHFIETETGRWLVEKIPRVQYPTGAGSVAWHGNGSGVFYARYPQPGERPEAELNFHQQIYFHKLGTPVKNDRYEIGSQFPRIAETELASSEDGRFVLATVANGDGGDFAHYLRGPTGAWRTLTRFEDGIKRAVFGRDDALYLLSRKNAPRGKILRLPLEAPELGSERELVKESEAVIESFVPSKSGIYVADLVGGPAQIRFFNHEGILQATLPIKELSAVPEMLCRHGDELLFRNVSYTEPSGWFTWEPGTNGVARTALAGGSPVDFAGMEVRREFATSRDGTKVPLNILRRKGTKLDGQNPTLLYGYGGFGLSQKPNFQIIRRLWLDAGGVWVIANLRGGGEFGEAWHLAGNLMRKQNVFDDFAAAASYLVTNRYTNPQKLAIEGGSNGGLLMGAFLTQHPDMVRALVGHVGIYDMLRAELEPNGAFNVTEYGTVRDRSQFEALLAYSPFHRVRVSTAYPAVLLMAGDNDGRVNPSNSRKMAARLQAATTSERPVLLRTTAGAGHGMGSSLREQIAGEADALAFLFDQLGMDISRWVSRTPIERGPWSGAITPTSAVVKARLGREGAVARLAVDRDPQFPRPMFSRPARAEAKDFRIVSLPIQGLAPDTEYHYALEIDGQLERARPGSFRTFPLGASSFSFAFASCAKTASTNPVFTTIRENHPLFFMHCGDFHYLNIKQNIPWKFRRAYDRVLGSATQGELYRQVPFIYVWDDHDFGGANSDRKAASHHAARALYETYVPHYPLALDGDDEPIAQSFVVGRAKFIITDLRSDRDDPRRWDISAKSMMGTRQKEWFKKELLDAQGKYPLIFWVSSVPWLGLAGTNYYPVKTNVFGYIHHAAITDAMRWAPDADDDDLEDEADLGEERAAETAATRRRASPPRYPFGEDHWSVYATERREIANFIKDNRIQGVCILHGDSHMLAADDGSHSDFARGGGAPLPVMCAGPLDQRPSLKGGPYSQGVYRVRPDEGCFGLVTVTDLGTNIQVGFSGRNYRNEEKISLKFAVPAK